MCKHNSISVFEYGMAFTEHTLEDGRWYHTSGFGSYTGKVDIHCFECGIERTYYSKRPKWLVNKLNEMKGSTDYHRL